MIECLESIKEVQPASSKQLVHPLKLKLLQSKNTAKQNSNIVESKWGKTSSYNLQDNTKLEVLSISPNIMETATSFHTWIYFLVTILVSSRLEEIDRTENPCMGRRQSCNCKFNLDGRKSGLIIHVLCKVQIHPNKLKCSFIQKRKKQRNFWKLSCFSCKKFQWAVLLDKILCH